MIARLALMLFLQNAVGGVLVPMFSVRLDKLGFSPWQIGVCSAVSGLIAMGSPLLGQVADRMLSPNRILACCGVWCAIIMASMPFVETYQGMLLTTLGYWMGAMPMSLMCSSIAFSLLENPERDFGKVRMWGTIGWMAPPWIVLSLGAIMGWDRDFLGGGALYLGIGAFLSLVLAGHALTLPMPPPRTQGVARLAPLAALRHLSGTTFACLALAIFGWCLIHPFNVQGTPLLLLDLLSDEYGQESTHWLPAILTLGQIPEVAIMMLLPLAIRVLGIRGSMILGLGAWLTTLLMLSVGKPLAMVVGSLLLNGLVIANLLVAGQVYLNGEVPKDLKASVQSVFFTVQGLGLMIGNLAFGGLRAAIPESDFDSDLPTIFGIGAGLTGLIFLVFLAGFHPARKTRASGLSLKKELANG